MKYDSPDAPALCPAPAVEAKNVFKCHNLAGRPVEVIRDLSVSIAKGDFVAIMGASGSGKSTLLSLLGTLDAPTSGEILIDGQRTGNLAPCALASFRSSRIGFIFQQFHLLARTKVIDQVTLPSLYGPAMTGARGTALSLLRDVGLTGFEDHLPSQLSGGQQQRVAIARALLKSPSLILADEPTGSLDQTSGLEIMRILSDLNKSGITIVVVTHDASVAKHARRTIRLVDGRIASDENKSQLLETAA